MTNKFDLIVIGTGPAASTVARKANKAGKRVAIIESREFGGTCALRGCNPKKVYTNAGALVDQARRADGKLARFDRPRIVWPELLAFKREFTEPVREKSEDSFSSAGIATYHGVAAFIDEQTLQAGEQRLEAERILLATGARPRPLEMPGGEYVIRSDEFFELDDLPKRITFIGGGYVSMEFAHVAARYGVEVQVLQRGEQILAGFDPDLVDRLTEWSRTNGIDVQLDSEVESVEKMSRGGYSLSYQKGGESKTLETDLVIHGAGRQPNLEGLNLKAGNVACSKHGILVDDFLRSTTNQAVFAAGDCAASDVPKLTPTANEEARAVAKNLFADNPTAKPQYGAVARVAFTSPSLAAVGKSEAAAQEQGYDLDVRQEDTSSWGSVRKTAVECAGYKILIDKQTDLILGAHLLGPGAEETINLFTLAMTHNLTATQMKSTLFAFPTFASDVRQMV